MGISHYMPSPVKTPPNCHAEFVNWMGYPYELSDYRDLSPEKQTTFTGVQVVVPRCQH
jgi:hypothetical protein